ncbi:LexA family protein [Undibacterium sp. Ji42W]|uniref:LexA family protein n=1 Tax=Undibacterium sp. Ji42W TaxID=3413039 RepID=UPI003BF22792
METTAYKLALIGIAAQQPIPCKRPLINHKVSAGFASPALDFIEKDLDLNLFLVSHKEATYYFEVSGHCMTGIGIFDKDVIVVDRSIDATHGNLVLAVIDEEYTLKRLYQKFGRIELHPENPMFEPIRLTEGQELQIWGVITGNVRKYKV